MMNQLIGLLLPSIVSLRTYDKIYGEEKMYKNQARKILKKCFICKFVVIYNNNIYF